MKYYCQHGLDEPPDCRTWDECHYRGICLASPRSVDPAQGQKRFRTGDVVRHIPSGEKWLVAWADTSEVVCCGWPESIAKASDCHLERAATDEEHLDLLKRIASSGRPSYRGARCREELARRCGEEHRNG